jgi:hypothetical protein
MFSKPQFLLGHLCLQYVQNSHLAHKRLEHSKFESLQVADQLQNESCLHVQREHYGDERAWFLSKLDTIKIPDLPDAGTHASVLDAMTS